MNRDLQDLVSQSTNLTHKSLTYIILQVQLNEIKVKFKNKWVRGELMFEIFDYSDISEDICIC